MTEPEPTPGTDKPSIPGSDEDQVGGGDWDWPSGGGNGSTGTGSGNSDKEKENPQSGDHSFIPAAMLLLACASGAVIFTLRKK